MPVGAQGHVGLRTEASFASGGAIDVWQPVNSATIGITYNNLYSDRIRNTSEQVSGETATTGVAGSFTFPVSARGPLQWWRSAVGGSASPYAPARPLDSMLFQVDQEQGTLQASGCKISSLSIGSNSGGEVTASVDIEGKGAAEVTAGTPSFISGDVPFLHSDGTYKLNGVTVTNITAWSLSINNNLITDLYGTGQARSDIAAGKTAVSGSFTKLFNDSQEYNAFIANAGTRSFQITLAKGGRSFDLVCNRIKYNSRPSELSGQNDYIMETFEFTAFVEDPSAENSVALTISQ